MLFHPFGIQYQRNNITIHAHLENEDFKNWTVINLKMKIRWRW